jgi:hypothetical protein
MQEKVLPEGSRDLLAAVAGRAPRAQRVPRPLRGWTLAGGTGLAMSLGHRVSEDFDFFRTTVLEPSRLLEALRGLGSCEVLQEEDRTLTVLLRGIKLSFFLVRDPFLFPAVAYSFFRIADVRDIALMKLAAILNRGSRKDFVDLYSILRRGLGLQELFSWLPAKYGPGRVNEYQLLKSLCYFEDAEQEPLPRLLEPFDWRECKAFFQREARAIILPERSS